MVRCEKRKNEIKLCFQNKGEVLNQKWLHILLKESAATHP